MTVRNELDRYHLAGAAIERVARIGARAGHVMQHLRDKLIEHRAYIEDVGEDMPEIRDWMWTPWERA